MVESTQNHGRFEDRLQGILTDAQIMAKDAAGAAHRLFNSQAFKGWISEGRTLRLEDSPKEGFVLDVRRRLVALMRANLANHVLFRHLPKGRTTALTEEVLFWDIRLSEGQPQLSPEAAEAIFNLNDWIHNLPAEAHGILFPLHYEGYSQGHATRVGIYSALLAQKIGNPDLEPEEAAAAGFLHDLGKLMPMVDKLVRAPRRLDESERDYVGLHPWYGAALWGQMQSHGLLPDTRSRLYDIVHDGILEHHLRPDGKGYPPCTEEQRFGPLTGKVVAVADAFDAMTSHRLYENIKKENRLGFAYEELKRCAGLEWDATKTEKQEPEGQFDPLLVREFMSMSPTPTFHAKE